MTLNPGDSLFNGHYQIVRLQGRGGYGFVYQARNTLLNQTVAIKELIPALLGDEATLKRFLAEARATMRLTHRHIVRTHNVFQEGDNYYIVMEYMAGGSLEQRLREGSALTVNEAVQAAAEVCAGLACAHEEQVVHCDLKPANILFDAQGRAKVADFGIAHVSGEMLTRSWHTPAGFVAGTLPYMSPEQLDGVRDDPRVDVYAVGAVLYRMLTGQPYLAFEPRETPRAQVENVSRILSEVPSPPSLHNALIPSWLDGVVLRALVKEPDARYPAIEAMRAALLQQPEATPAESPAFAPTTILPSDEAPGISEPDLQTPPGPVDLAVPTKGRRFPLPHRFWPAAGGVAALLIVLGIALALLLGGGSDRDPEPTEAPGTAIVAVATLRPADSPATRGTGAPEAAVAATATLAPTHTPVPRPPQQGEVRTRAVDGMDTLFVPQGSFTMGSDEFDDAPQHIVRLDAFWIDRTEVTNAQFRLCVEAGACRAPTTCDDGYPSFEDEDKAQRPVVCVEWSQAEAYCAWTGGRLPTEAEWEKAARGNDGRAFPWGDELPDCAKANTFSDVSQKPCVGQAADVGSHPSGASPYGAEDMAGNVWEWVADWYDPDYYPRAPYANPQGSISTGHRVLRGGSWKYNLPDLRAAFRNYDPPDIRRDNIGFRCAESDGG